MQVSKDSIDLGIVVTDEKAALGFYRDELGLEWEGELPVPGGRMYRLKCGTTVIKLLKLDRTPEAKPAPGGPWADSAIATSRSRCPISAD